ncbi:class II glutamine amidotransferase [Avibacterium paragallinarum]|uniref:Class II glutamine amidotransferase n=3 Tax=Avibacterium paragallinarum TaxID=728 RepID=A0A2V4F0Q1_AVIPA|nr:class II glutamine amidotransferase [Avibacterium paragallinarum]MEE3607879.1 class II glutamine amidotransferase [Avibacterium paragallinarum]MEE3620306.1 class II glutamine amidotransferase [Avibacterium paragallinarum]MEE3668204.1 class II glutamine amidotransferase [Avibacterium paragallinarum]MEE3679723.1 class II glutamine amidotransferase [Avibacterium paragallinarum]MEE4385127.1 class II glutamine amidotransferase [Avibacterium paragallinarum]
MCQLLGMNCNTPTDIVFSFEGFRRRAGLTDCHSDGFGIAFFEGKGVRIFRDNKAGHSSPIADCVKQYHIKSFNVIAHIRKATQGAVTIENTHPFIREIWGENWVFAHNGNLTSIPDMSESFCQPIGSTDSEAAFCYMAEQLKNRFRKKPTEEEIFQTIQEITKELAQNGTFNFILSNGNWMIAHCSTNLHYLTRKSPFGTAQRIDDDDVIDFREYTTEKDKVTIITTFPLTKNEPWIKMEHGGFVFFKDGDKVYEVLGKATASIDDGTLGLAKIA